jgi:NAD(P)-dependent dehydrogenase (short-subunit alcohol dehydrogenase family)
LISEGARAVFTGRNEEAGNTIAKETGATFFKHDVTDAAGYDDIANHIKTEFGRLDIAFANAGTEIGDADIEDINLENWNNLIGINLTGAMLTAQMATRVMRENSEGATGSIILNSSMTAHKPLSNFISYSTAKGAHIAMAKSIATHCAGKGYKIRCNVVHPGVVETEMISAIIEGAPDSEAARGQFNSMAQLNRMASVEEIAGLVVYLGSDEAAFISGSSFNIDGASTAGMMGV